MNRSEGKSPASSMGRFRRRVNPSTTVDLLERGPDADLASALILLGHALLSTRSSYGREGRRELAVALLTGGVTLTSLSKDEIRSFNGSVSDQEIERFLAAFDGEHFQGIRRKSRAGARE